MAGLPTYGSPRAFSLPDQEFDQWHTTNSHWGKARSPFTVAGTAVDLKTGFARHSLFTLMSQGTIYRVA
jgi:hypothetical protein